MTHSRAAVGILVVLIFIAAFAGILAKLSDGPDGPPPSNRSSWTDDHGRLCTQVDPPGPAIALDCDFPQETS